LAGNINKVNIVSNIRFQYLGYCIN